MPIDDRPTITEHAWRLAVVDRVVGARQLPVESIANAGEQAEGSPAPHYEIIGRLGKGGMALVLDARQTSLEREVALKIFRPSQEEGADLAEELRQFAHEAVVTARLDHPHVVPVYALAKDHRGRLFFTMKKVDGIPWRFLLHPEELRDPERQTQVRLRAESLDWQDHLRILLKVMDAVAYAHSKGVLHRDLKPSNVMVGDFGEVYVMDWGLAMPFGPEIELADEVLDGSEIKVVGTPRYMAPEMITGKKSRFSEATDVHLLGGILFEIITGRPPRHGKNTHEIIAAAVAGRIEDPAQVPGAKHVTPHVRRIVLKAMAADPADRYSNVTVMRADLEAYLIHADAITEAEDAALDLAGLTGRLVVGGAEAGHAGEASLRRLERGEAVVAYDALAECISRLRQSLGRYPVNGAARAALLDALLIQIRIAIDQGDLTLAEAQVRALDGVPGPGTDETFTRTVRAQAEALGLSIYAERRRRKSSVRSATWLKAAVIVLLVLAAAGLAWGYLMADARRDQAIAGQALMFQTAVRGRARMIEQFLIEVERLTAQYREEASDLLTSPLDRLAPRKQTPAGRWGFYYDEDFYTPATAPPDLGTVEGYEQPVSLSHPTVVRAQWVQSPEAVAVAEQDAQRLARLGRRFGQVHRAFGTDLKWSLAGTRSGLLIGFPGSGRYRDRPDYDPTTRPWYRLAADAPDDAPRWGSPYTDATTGLRLIPCMARVRAGETTMAVVGVEVTLATAQRILLDFAQGIGGDMRALLLRSTDGGTLEVLVDTDDDVRGADWRSRPQMPTLDDIEQSEPAIARFVREALVDRGRSPMIVGDRLFTHAFLAQHDNWLLVVTTRHGE